MGVGVAVGVAAGVIALGVAGVTVGVLGAATGAEAAANAPPLSFLGVVGDGSPLPLLGDTRLSDRFAADSFGMGEAGCASELDETVCERGDLDGVAGSPFTGVTWIIEPWRTTEAS